MLEPDTAYQRSTPVQRAQTQRLHTRGFSIIELMIVLAIVGIIVAFAVPNYAKYITDGRRTDAMSFLSEAAGEQIRYFTSNNQYADTMQELGYGTADTFTTPEGHYTVSVANPGTGRGRFTLTATPIATGKQARDTECAAFTITDTGAKQTTGTDTDCW